MRILLKPTFYMGIFIYKNQKNLNQLKKMRVCKQQIKIHCFDENHNEFYDILEEIKEKNQIYDCLSTIDNIYGLKQYKIMNQSPSKVVRAYQSICQRILSGIYRSHRNCWVGYELKVFLWLIVCDLFLSIQELQKIPISIWQKYQRIFHGKSIDLMQYQVKLIIYSRGDHRKWQKDEQMFLVQIIRSNSNNFQWNSIAKKFYFQSSKTYFRSPKQIRQHYINHMDQTRKKIEWTIQEDYEMILNVMKYGRKWSKIAKLNLNKRTDHMIKNRYHSLIKKQQKLNPQCKDSQKLSQLLSKRLQGQKKTQRNSEEGHKSTQTKSDCQLKQKQPFFKRNGKLDYKKTIQSFTKTSELQQIHKPQLQFFGSFIELQFEDWLQNSEKVHENPALRLVAQQEPLGQNEKDDLNIL